jgi:hypothetical protein
MGSVRNGYKKTLMGGLTNPFKESKEVCIVVAFSTEVSPLSTYFAPASRRLQPRNCRQRLGKLKLRLK